MELDEIIKDTCKSIGGYWEIRKILEKSGLKHIDNLIRIPPDIIIQAHTAILKWVREKMPPENDGIPTTDLARGLKEGYNLYRQEALKNLGIEEEK